MIILGNYAKNFSIDLDGLWKEMDKDGNLMLDKSECKSFIQIVTNFIAPERAQNYNAKDFTKLFNLYDEDKNGFISKSEMAVFLKKVFVIPKNKVNR